MTQNPTSPHSANPFNLFTNWLSEAEKAELNDPSAMALATIDEHNMPNVRMVLLRGWENERFTFFTNHKSQKGRELSFTPNAALCLHWKSLRRQVRVQGSVVATSPEEADAYFNARPRGSRIAAWASLQSEPLDKRATLLERYKSYEQEFIDQEIIPRPPHWSGFHVIPTRIEFWSEIEFRMHERLVFERNSNSDWKSFLLYP